MNTITSDNEACLELINRFPFLKEERDYEEDLIEIGSDPLFCSTVVPFVVRNIQDPKTNEKVLKEIFTFMEELASSPISDVSNIVYVSFCEPILNEVDNLELLRPFMGKQTCKSMAKALRNSTREHLAPDWD